MPFFMIPTALAVCFFLMWAFIGGMIFRDSQLSAERDQDADIAILPISIHRGPSGPHLKRRGKKAVGIAS